ncbi:MAG: hypothetical protein M9928_22855 [Anaerolineae bacterium]|nr:hypothetical protein [Anaerolineae bacterium]MCO5196655.1 hypothetical protein [Anaerolineae bacterium]MCO5207853.1 hypothetical protein [Anaerolineae bacterium]
MKKYRELLIYLVVLICSGILFVLSIYASNDGSLHDVLLNIASDLFVASAVVVFIRYIVGWRPEEEQQYRQETLLGSIKSNLEGILATYTFGVQYLENAASVRSELEKAISRADDNVLSLGAKSQASEYLEAISEAIQKRQVIYHRLLNDSHIPHELHKHLQDVIDETDVQIGWTPKTKFANMTITEHESIIVLPAPSSDKFSAIKLPGKLNSHRYKRYFFEAFDQSISIRTDKGVEILCEECSPDTARNPVLIKKILLEELDKASRP